MIILSPKEFNNQTPVYIAFHSPWQSITVDEKLLLRTYKHAEKFLRIMCQNLSDFLQACLKVNKLICGKTLEGKIALG